MLKQIIQTLQDNAVVIRGCARTKALAKNTVELATEEDYFMEYLDKIISIKIIDDINHAIHHINHYGSHHTDAIITENQNNAEKFLGQIDSAIVVHNASTQFADGGEFGKGAEIGIATGRFHARGPVGVEELMIYNYRVRGTGQTRP